jgi:hypothetical protein
MKKTRCKKSRDTVPLISSLNRRVRAARGLVAWPKPTSNAYVRKAKIACCTTEQVRSVLLKGTQA